VSDPDAGAGGADGTVAEVGECGSRHDHRDRLFESADGHAHKFVDHQDGQDPPRSSSTRPMPTWASMTSCGRAGPNAVSGTANASGPDAP